MVEINPRPKRLGWQLVGISAVLLVVGVFIMNSGNSTAMIPACLSAAMTVLLSLVSEFRMILGYKRSVEEVGAIEFHKTHGNTELFGDADEAVRIATRNDVQYTKYFVPIITMVFGIVLGIIVLLFWFHWKSQLLFLVAPSPLPMAILSFCCCILTLVGGSYFIGISREKGCRWVRPGSAWLFLSGFLFLLASIAFFCEYFKKATMTIDLTMAKIGIVILGVLAVELLIAFVVEFYRPRMPGEEERPLLESRLLALFTEPGGVARNVAASLDYQFGFQVSEAWFYRFIERTMVPLLVVLVLAFWFQTCIVVVGSSENGMRQRFGKVLSAEALQPGVYYKLPYPFESIYRFPSARVQELTVGVAERNSEDEDEDEVFDDGCGAAHSGPRDENADFHNDSVIVWDIQHSHGTEADLLIGDKNVLRATVDVPNGRNNQGVGILTAHVPVYFKVKDLYKYTYNTSNPAVALKNLARREMIEYFLCSNWQDMLGAGRGEATEVLIKRIQEKVDAYDMGIEIVSVALTGLHPPKGTGAAFDNVTGAMINKQQMITDAKSYADHTKSQSETSCELLMNVVNAYKDMKSTQASAEEARYMGQVMCYEACPSMYLLNSYFEVLNGARAVRKYIVMSDLEDEVLWLNLEKKNKNILSEINFSEAQP